jgi:hypothetical protein
MNLLGTFVQRFKCFYVHNNGIEQWFIQTLFSLKPNKEISSQNFALLNPKQCPYRFNKFNMRPKKSRVESFFIILFNFFYLY